ncbi:tenascin-R-like isoform X1 [Ptychodera flava]|uniref:tenascin-R-like isoform X1 n=1 Tax=Ptychodera flava TaxID=63121 RepID=UPI003969CE5F
MSGHRHLSRVLFTAAVLVAVAYSQDTVGNLASSEVTTTSLKLTWDPPVQSATSISYFIIISPSRTTGGGSLETVSTTEATITGLSPGTEYTFSVKVSFDNVLSDNEETLTVSTLSDTGNNIQVTQKTETLLILSWTEPSGSVFNYDLSYQTGSNALSTQQESGNTALISSLTPGALYTVSVSYRATSGASPTALYTTTIRMLPLPPSSLTTSGVTSNSVTVQFSPPSSGQYDNYELTTTPSGGTESAPVTIAKEATTYTVSGLTTDTEYTVSLYAVSGTGAQTERSDPITTTATPVSFLLTVTTVTTNFLVVEWDEPAGTYDSVVLTYAPESDQSTPTDANSIGANQAFASGLTSGTAYMLRLYTVAGGVRSEVVNQVEYTAPAKPLTDAAPTITANTVTVTWSEPDGSRDHYKVTYSPANGLTDARGQPGDRCDHLYI